MVDIADRPTSVSHYEELLRCRDWRLNNLYKIKNKFGKKVTLHLNQPQLALLGSSHTRNLILKARQLGFTTFIQIYMLDACLFTANTNAGVIAHNQEDAQVFFKDKIKFAYDNLPDHIKELIPAVADSARELRFKNGSFIRVGTSLRSGTYRLLHISEYGKLCAQYPERANEVKSGALNTVPTDGEIWIESTAEGRNGHFYDLCERTQAASTSNFVLSSLDFKFHFFPWFSDSTYALEFDVIEAHQYRDYFDTLAMEGISLTAEQQAWYAKTAAIQGEDMKREYPSTPKEAFEVAIEGAYFSRQMTQLRAKKQICSVPIESGIPIHTFWDLGRDTTVVWFFQHVGFDYRFCDYFQNSGEGMAYYLKMLKDRDNGGESYLYGDAYLPHDGVRKGMAEKSPADQLYDNGYSVRIVDRTPDKTLSIERARHTLPLCYFDEVKCIEGIKALDGYRKEWDEKLGTWKTHPLHNQFSHGSDGFMTFADGWHLPREIENDNDELLFEGRNITTGY